MSALKDIFQKSKKVRLLGWQRSLISVENTSLTFILHREECFSEAEIHYYEAYITYNSWLSLDWMG